MAGPTVLAATTIALAAVVLAVKKADTVVALLVATPLADWT